MPLEFNSKNSKLWSRMGVRAVYGMALYDLAKTRSDIMAVSADLGRSSGLKQYADNLHEQYVNVGIAEQNMIGVSAGLAREGYKVFASSFAPFISMRASEQIRMSLGYMQYPVNLVALGSGLAMGFLGNSHYGIEDMAVIRSIPGMSIVSPADCTELIKTLHAALDYEAPLYIRLTAGVDAPIVYEKDYDFKIGKAVQLCDGGDLCFIAIGSMVNRALELAEHLKVEYAIKSTVLNMHTLKPLDSVCLHTLFKRFSKIITIEEHTLIGGLFSTIAEFKALNNYASQLIPFGIKDEFLDAGNYQFTLKEAGLDFDSIFIQLKKTLNLKDE